MNFFKQLTWQAVALILGGGIIFLLLMLFAPPDVRAWLIGANGLVGTVLGLLSQWRRLPTGGES